MNNKFAVIGFGAFALVAVVLFLALNGTRPAAATSTVPSNESANTLREAWEFVHASNAIIQSPSLRGEMDYLLASNASPANVDAAQTPLTLRTEWEYVRASNASAPSPSLHDEMAYLHDSNTNANPIPVTGGSAANAQFLTLRDEMEYLHASNATSK